MTVTDVPATGWGTPTDRLLTWSLVVAPIVYLVADSLYALRGWDDGDAGVVHVLGAVAYAFVFVRVATWWPGRLGAAVLLTGIAGACGNVAYGFNTIHVALGGNDLNDATGPAVLIKPLGLLGPLAFLLVASGLVRAGRRAAGIVVGVAAVLWPVAHIANIGWLAVVVSVLLVAGFAPLAASRRVGA